MTKKEIRAFKNQQREQKIQKLKDEGKRVPKELLEEELEDKEDAKKEKLKIKRTCVVCESLSEKTRRSLRPT